MKRIFLFAMVMLLAVGASAEQDEQLGKVDSLLDEFSGVVIDDSAYPFALNAKIFDLKGKTSNRYLLKDGDVVRYRFAEGANGYNQITHIWLMPKGTKVDQAGEDRD